MPLSLLLRCCATGVLTQVAAAVVLALPRSTIWPGFAVCTVWVAPRGGAMWLRPGSAGQDDAILAWLIAIRQRILDERSSRNQEVRLA